MSEYPQSWTTMALSDAVTNITITDKKIPQKEYLTAGSYPVFDQGQEYIGGYTDKKEKLVECELPVIVFGDHTRAVKFVNQIFAPGADGVKVLQPKRFFIPKLFEYFCLHLATHLTSHGYARHYQHLAKSIIPLPPTNEQHRIVTKIEALFSELDKGIESFKTAREQLKIYRQALLKHAFSGKLTEQWRTENQSKLESAETMLQRIQTERQQRYQQQLENWEIGGKQGSKPKAPKTLRPLTAEELAELPELPEGWEWLKLADVSDISGGLTKNQKREQLPLLRPYLRVANVYANRLELEEIHNIGVSENELDRVRLEDGDLLIVEGNGSIDQIGRVAIWKNQIPGCVHQNHLIKSRPLNIANSKFLLYFLMSEAGRKFIVRAASSTSGLHTLSISKVEGLFIPLCNKGEQEQVVLELESTLSGIDQLDQTITTALQQAEALRQSILKKAFSGQLVPQDPNDEPASVLLERIQAEKAQADKQATRRRGKKG